MKPNTNIHGVTLIELMIVISIVAILATYSFSSFGNMLDKQRLRAAGEKIFSDLRLAQSESINRNRKVYVSFVSNALGWCYGRSVDKPCDCDKKNQCLIDNQVTIVNHEEFKGIQLQRARFAGGKNYTAFDPIKGFAFADGVKNGTIWLKSREGSQLAVIVNRLGRVRFCSPTLSDLSKQCPKKPN